MTTFAKICAVRHHQPQAFHLLLGGRAEDVGNRISSFFRNFLFLASSVLAFCGLAARTTERQSGRMAVPLADPELSAGVLLCVSASALQASHRTRAGNLNSLRRF